MKNTISYSSLPHATKYSWKFFVIPFRVTKITKVFYLRSLELYGIYWYEAIGTINPFKQPEHALELNFADCRYLPACLPAHPPTWPPAHLPAGWPTGRPDWLTDWLTDWPTDWMTTTINLQPKLLGVFFPSAKYISVHTSLSYFHGIYFHLL